MNTANLIPGKHYNYHYHGHRGVVEFQGFNAPGHVIVQTVSGDTSFPVSRGTWTTTSAELSEIENPVIEKMRSAMVAQGFSAPTIERLLIDAELIEKPKEKFYRVTLEIPVDRVATPSWWPVSEAAHICSTLSDEWEDDWYVSHETIEK